MNVPRTVVLLLAAATAGCTSRPEMPELTEADSLRIVQENIAHRETKEEFLRHDPASPFNRDTTIDYYDLQWYPIDPRYRGTSTLYRYDRYDTVTVMGTGGERRHHLKYGYFQIVVPDTQGNPVRITLNVYKFTPHDRMRYSLYREYLNVWFTDETTGHETYEVGRYVDTGPEQTEPEHQYTIDLNKAYNPYCAYSSLYSCAIPRADDHIPVSIRAGEKKFHQ